MLKRIGKYFLKTVFFVVVFIAAYFLLALLCSVITVNTSEKIKVQRPIDIFILSNGVHTDIVLPLKNELSIERTFASFENVLRADSSYNYVAYGWGDRGFYLDTKTWADLKFSTAFNAMFYRSKSALHISFYKRLNETKHCVRVSVSRKEFMSLISQIKLSFQLDSVGMPLLIKGAAYSDNDCFYEANGTYGMFNTCNTWANDILKNAGMKACLWTPFSFFILSKYR